LFVHIISKANIILCELFLLSNVSVSYKIQQYETNLTAHFLPHLIHILCVITSTLHAVSLLYCYKLSDSFSSFCSYIPFRNSCKKNEKCTLELLLSITIDQGAHKAACRNDRHVCQLIMTVLNLFPFIFLSTHVP